jgi:AraC family L-rhamnose operon transcriptional activator RhaR
MIMPAARHRITDLNHLPLSLKLGNTPSNLLNWGFIDAQPWRNYLHTHSCFEVCYAFQGAGIFRIMDTDHQVNAGQVFVARPGEPHEIIANQTDPLGIYFWAYTLNTPAETPPAPTGIDALLDAFRTTQRWVGEAPSMQPTLDLLVEEIAGQEAGYQEAIPGLVLKLLLDTCRAVVQVPIRAAAPAAPRYSSRELTAHRIAAYLHDNYSRPVSIRDVAAQVHLSERHTNRLFRDVMGASITDYLTELRLDIAGRLLIERTLSIKEVAHAVGYSDTRYFTTLFHHRMGLPPATFRRRNGTRLVDPKSPFG